MRMSRRLTRRHKIVVGVVAIATIGVAGVTAGEAFAAGRHPGHSAGARPSASALPSAVQGIDDMSGPSPAASLTPTPSAPAPTSARPAGTPTKAATTTKAATAPAASDTVVSALLSQINQLRAANGLPAYTLSSGLNASAHAHNLTMIAGCGLSHQCSGESSLGARISAQGVKWTACGENIGEGGPVSNTGTAITGMAKGLTTSMYNETPPNDGHRKNLLSSSFTHVGIDVIRDSKGTVWMTQDFSN